MSFLERYPFDFEILGTWYQYREHVIVAVRTDSNVTDHKATNTPRILAQAQPAYARQRTQCV